MKVFIKTRNEVHVPTVLKMHKASEAVVSQEDNQVVIADLPEESINELRKAPQFEVYDDIEFQPAPPSGAEWWRRQIGQPLPMLAPVWHSKTQKRYGPQWSFERLGDVSRRRSHECCSRHRHGRIDA